MNQCAAQLSGLGREVEMGFDYHGTDLWFSS